MADQAEIIYLATDPDREGEAISWHIYDILSAKNQKKCKRVSYSEITKTAVMKAINEARAINMNWVDAQKARQVLDRLIGYKISPILWHAVQPKTSAGRVQSIALKFVSLKEKEIKAFKPEDFWYIEALMKSKNGEFWTKVVTKDKDNRYLDEKIAKSDLELLKKASFTVGSIESEQRSVKPYPPFDTSSLQSTCSSIFGWGAKKTATIAQDLYSSGKISYIRTDSFNIAEEAIADARTLIGARYASTYLPKTKNVYEKKSKVSAQEAHECIRPTHVEDECDDLNGDNLKLYKLIRDRFLACQMTNMEVKTVTCIVKASSGHSLIAKGSVIVFDGWNKVYNYGSNKEEILPDLKKDESVTAKEIEKTYHATKPPPRFNEGSLIKKMEGEGVGRPSTYASIMEGLQFKGYIEKIKDSKGALCATELGLKIFDYLDPNFSKDFFMDPVFTAAMEDELDDIRDGKQTYVGLLSKHYDIIVREVGKAQQTMPEKNFSKSMDVYCTECKKGMIVERKGKFGNFYCCDKYPECKTIFVLKEDKTFEKKESKQSESTGSKCIICGKGDILKRKGPFGDFFACSAFPKCKTVFEQVGKKFLVKNKFSKSENKKEEEE